MNPVIKLDGVKKTFGTHPAVDGLSLQVPAGSIFGLLGRNGAGKTTTIRMIMDILRPDEGSIQVLGTNMADGIKDRIGYLPEERGLYPKMKVLEMLEFQGTIKGLSPGDSRKRAKHWLERLEVADWAEKKVEELSKGMQQKIQFIAAIIAQPEIIILDEPFSGMDPVNQDIFKDLILELNRKGTTVVFSTHVMDSAEKLCKEIALIDKGRAVLDGPLTAIKQEFGKNTIQLECEGDTSFLKQLPDVESVNDYGQYLEIKIRPGARPQDLLKACVDRLTIHRFGVVSPTLHNIFVEKVGREKKDA